MFLGVYRYVSTHQDTELKIERVLKICQDHDINDASAFLLERTGDTQGALELTLKTVDKSVSGYCRSPQCLCSESVLFAACESGLKATGSPFRCASRPYSSQSNRVTD